MTNISPAASLSELYGQLKALQEAIAARKDSAIAELRQAFEQQLSANKLTISDIYPELQSQKIKEAAAPKSKSEPAAKFRHPGTGETWAGTKGPQPKWVKNVLEERSWTLEQFKEANEFKA